MRKTTKIIAIIAIGVAIIAGYINTYWYTMPGTVIAVNGQTVSVEDWRGELWKFSGSGYTEGDCVDIKFYNNGSLSYIYDDDIVDVTK